MIYELPEPARYSLDTGCLINAWKKNYPPDMFAPVWRHVDGLIARKIVVASVEVLHELAGQDDDLHTWVKVRDAMFLDLIEPLQNEVTAIMAEYPKLVTTGRNRADPFVVGVACLGKESLTVVTEETSHRASRNKPKIPFICCAMNIRCIRFIDMLRETEWRLA
ncbi:MAG: DUF4411 family protein [Pseudomonadota bacterium]